MRENLTSDLTRNQILDAWFHEADVDLQCAKILYDNCFYSRCLYHLQQGNEKLAKGILLSLGILSAKKAIQNQRIKSIVGFIPKEPASYRHRILPFFLSDMSSATPALDKIIKSIEWEDAEDIFLNFQGTIEKSKKGIEKLKKKPFTLVISKDQLENEIKVINMYLDKLGEIEDKMQLALTNLNPGKATKVAVKTAQKFGYEATNDQALESYYGTSKRVVPIINLSFLAILSIAVASFLDPLESITRYPDSNHGPFTEDNVYVEYFSNLYEILRRTLEKTIKANSEHSKKTM
jgi:hypothetical protein